ncbi:hypothetical protein L1787_12345 [Acuticoccus sp. M5D2P5]|uniref:spike base protein, RCAP_Rcc01079 family n=1 Tax=Acuticoccus kalidii TaxID=2910977 RepID=UPI001F1A233F|nr:hypothetical protein [Acuticoccus kalidii]MCF3934197.1 hypothetical protein [Acuticoccus kalidii]
MPADNPFQSYQRSASAPASDAFTVTPSDGTDLATVARGLFVGGAGNVNVVTLGGTTVMFPGVAAGTILPCGVTRVLATDTTATNIVALV